MPTEREPWYLRREKWHQWFAWRPVYTRGGQKRLWGRRIWRIRTATDYHDTIYMHDPILGVLAPVDMTYWVYRETRPKGEGAYDD